MNIKKAKQSCAGNTTIAQKNVQTSTVKCSHQTKGYSHEEDTPGDGAIVNLIVNGTRKL